MAIQNGTQYMVYNYSPSRVAVKAKNVSYLFEGGTKDSPYGYPMTFEEIATANMNGVAFKAGLLFFDPRDQEDIYKELRIVNWKDILKDEDIEDIILHPTAEGYQKIINIDNDTYFDRVYGILYGLQSVFTDIPTQSKVIIEARKNELENHKRKSEIKIKLDSPIEDMNQKLAKKDEEINKLTDEITALKAELQKAKTSTKEAKASTKKITAKTDK